ncbi:MAG: helix-turn-helix transcriptional regulator [Candidatus Omnitrophica bacterium]|nr:helix-turn-helix transcriptional regulator [Candidatus Omnitrophota bacterium]
MFSFVFNIEEIESGKRKPTEDELKRMAKALRCKVEEIS